MKNYLVIFTLILLLSVVSYRQRSPLEGRRWELEDRIVLEDVSILEGQRGELQDRIKLEGASDKVSPFDALPKSIRDLYEGLTPKVVEFAEANESAGEGGRADQFGGGWHENCDMLRLSASGIKEDERFDCTVRFYSSSEDARRKNLQVGAGITATSLANNLGEGAYVARLGEVGFCVAFVQDSVYVNYNGTSEDFDMAIGRAELLKKLIEDHGADELCALWKESILVLE